MVFGPVFIGDHGVVDVDGCSERMMADVFLIGLEARHIGRRLFEQLVQQQHAALGDKPRDGILQRNADIGVFQIVFRRLEMGQRVDVHAAEAGHDEVFVAPVFVGGDVSAFPPRIVEEKLIRVAAEELERVQIVVVKLVLRQQELLGSDDAALAGEQHHRIRLCDGRGRERESIRSCAQGLYEKQQVQRFFLEGLRAGTDGVAADVRLWIERDDRDFGTAVAEVSSAAVTLVRGCLCRPSRGG